MSVRQRAQVMERAHKWHELNGIIYFRVVSDGTTGEAWVPRLEHKGFRLSTPAKRVLHSVAFKPTTRIVYDVAVMRGLLFKDTFRSTNHVRAEANRRQFTKSNLEVGCLIREKFTDEEIEKMGLWWIVIMHDPVHYEKKGQCVLRTDRFDGGGWLHVHSIKTGSPWDRVDGFALIESQTEL